MDRYFCLLCVLVIGLLPATSSGSVVNCPGMSQEAKDYALTIKQNLNITGFEGECTPVYRLDLSKKYIAYYVLLTDKDYIIMSAGKKTDECKIVVQAELPSPVTVMSKIAKKDGKKCDRYYLLAEDGAMICKDKKGKAVASTFSDRELEDILKIYDSLDKFLNARAKDWKKDWKKRAKRCSKSGKEKKKKPQGKSSGTDIDCEGIEPGQTISLALRDGVTQVRIEHLPMNGSDNATNKATFRSLCGAITGCSGNSGIISPKPNGEFDLILSSAAPNDALFKVVVKYSPGNNVERCFQVMTEPTGRSTEVTSWSGFRYCWIGNYREFPKYCDFYRNGCWYGQGGTIWAQIFAYYDRWTLRGGHCLFTSAWNGVHGGSCSLRAPYSMTERVKNYIAYFSALVRTSCGGSTWSSNMGNVANFWKNKETYGRPRIIRKDRDDAWVVDRLCGRWPVAVFHKNSRGGIGAHSVLATRWRRYYWRTCYTHSWRVCIPWPFCFSYSSWKCNGWDAVYDRDYYLDLGRCGSGNGWYNMNNVYAGAAVY